MKIVFKWESFSDIAHRASAILEQEVQPDVEWDIWDETFGKLQGMSRVDNMIRTEMRKG